jgi:hypothetical protein
MTRRMQKRLLAVNVLVLGMAFSMVAGAYTISKAGLAAYQALDAEGKLDYLWTQVTGTEYRHGLPTDGSNPVEQLLALAPAFLRVTFLNESDFMPVGRQKVIHTFGVVAQTDIEILPNSKYTGVLKSGAASVTRMSLASLTGSFSPGIAVKALVDGQPSINFLANFSLDGQGSDRNFFRNALCTQIPEPRGWILKQGARAFRHALTTFADAPDSELRLPLAEAASMRRDGSREKYPVIPEVLCFEPTEAMRAWHVAHAEDDFREELLRLPAGTELYTIRAQRPHSAWETIGSLRLRSAPVASQFGDQELFFQHQRNRVR